MKRMFLILTLALVATTLLNGCLMRQLSAGHYNEYNNRGLALLSRHDYESAKRRFLRAYDEAEAGFLGPRAKAAALYNYSLAAGHCGDYAEAEKAMKDAMKLDAITDGPDGPLASKRWLELARMYAARGMHSEAAASYKRGLDDAMKRGGKKLDPIAYAETLDDYAVELRKTGDDLEAIRCEKEAASVRAANPNVHPKTEIVPYPEPRQSSAFGAPFVGFSHHMDYSW